MPWIQTGANMKLVVNAVMGSMMAAFAEGMSLADTVKKQCQRVTGSAALVVISHLQNAATVHQRF
jgi:glyoxylate/succinic semialdehyde reductase